MTVTDPYADDPIVQKLEEAIWAFLQVKNRYPVLMTAAAEVDALRTRPDLRDRHANAHVVQILRDSFDMLVIDLYSIREAMTGRTGFFDLLRQNPGRLHISPSISNDTHLAQTVNEGLHEAQVWLVETADPATTEGIESLCRRFREGTQPLDADRNRVRAHRYENRGKDVTKLFVSLPDLKDQIDLMWSYLYRLYLILTNRGYSDELRVGDPKGTAKDLADLVTLGSINMAVTYYGMAEVTPQNPHPWYWKAREDALKVPASEPGVEPDR
jgi:hypothetical protein